MLRSTLHRLLYVLLALVVAPISAWADGPMLEGTVVSAWDGVGLEGARVVVAGGAASAVTDAHGRYRIDAGLVGATDVIVHLEGAEPVRFVGQLPGEDRTLHVFDERVSIDAAPVYGAPIPGRVQAQAEPVRLDDLFEGGMLDARVGDALPATIRVGRRFATSCSGNPVTRIDTVPLEEYVEGVLVPEIGVFKRVAGGPDSALEVYKAFAVAARSYAVWFYLQNPTAEYHLDDTACNQRYDEARDDFIRGAVDATAGVIMVAAHDAGLLDKLEYAASCGHHGTRPEYQDALVPDPTSVTACVGSWCGHTGCAGHEVNPAVPGEGRCLVRGICQWGSVERSMQGDTWREIIAHYQPNVQLLGVEGGTVDTLLVGYVREGDIIDGRGVPGVSVDLDTGERAITDDAGYFRFFDVAPGARTLTYSGGGIVATSQVKDVASGVTNWASMAVEREGGGVVDAGPGDTGVPDVGPEPDVGREDVGGGADTGVPPTDTGSPVDTGIADTGASSDTGGGPSIQPGDGGTTGRTDAGAREPTASAEGPLPVYSVVGSDGLGETGCACAVQSGPSGVRGTAVLGLLALLALRGRRR